MRHCGHKGTEMLSSKTWAVALKQCPVGIKELKNAHTTYHHQSEPLLQDEML